MEYKTKSKGRVPSRVTRRMAPARTSVPKSLNTLTRPPILSVKHRSRCLYNDNRQLTCTGAANNSYVFSVNGMYDPDISGLGHQPMGFDQLMALYEHYTVTSCKITASFVNESSTENAYVGIALFPDSSVEATPSKLVENGLLKRVWLAPKGDSKCQQIITQTCTVAKLNGRTGSIVGDELYRGDVASNPSEQSYFHVFAYNLASVSSCTVRIDCIVEYDAVFTEPRKLAQS